MQMPIKRLLLFTIAYLLLPHLIFILGWVSPAIALPVTAVLFFLGWKIVAITQVDDTMAQSLAISKKQTFYLLAICAALVAFAGIGELLWQRDDFFKHNLIFSDLLRNNWPVTYATSGQTDVLTYYLGWYMMPAAVGKLWGSWATALTSFLWTVAGLLLFFLWLKALLKTNRVLLWVVFLGISGFEFLWVAGHFAYYVLKYFPQYDLLTLLKGTFTYTRSELITPAFNQNIPSFFVAFLSAPQHVLPGFLASATIVYAIINKLPFRYTAGIGALTVFWSPLVCIGLLPFVIYHLYTDRKQVFDKVSIWCYVFCTIILFFTVSYLAAHAPLSQAGFVWQISGNAWWFYTLVFIALKFGVIFLYLFIKDKQLDFIGSYRILGYISLVGLIALSFYKLGAYNDLIARASIPFYFVLLLWGVFFLQKISTQKLKKYRVVWLIVGLMLLPRLWQVYKTAANTPQMATKKYKIADVPHDFTILNHNEWLLAVKPEYVKDYLIADDISQQYLGSTQSFFYVYLAK